MLTKLRKVIICATSFSWTIDVASHETYLLTGLNILTKLPDRNLFDFDFFIAFLFKAQSFEKELFEINLRSTKKGEQPT